MTLVFPTGELSESDFIRHVTSTARSFRESTVCFPSAIPYREQASEVSFLFLVPDDGLGWLNRLHGQLYSGPLGNSLDPTRPYIPHITVGKFKTFAEARALSESVNSKEICFCGQVSSIEVVRVASSSVQSVHSERLIGG